MTRMRQSRLAHPLTPGVVRCSAACIWQFHEQCCVQDAQVGLPARLVQVDQGGSTCLRSSDVARRAKCSGARDPMQLVQDHNDHLHIHSFPAMPA